LIIGADLDGFITINNWYKGKINLHWLIVFFAVIFLGPFIWPRRKIVKNLKRWAKENNDEIVIISARPKELEGLTKIWLFKYKVPYHHLVLVGTGKGVGKRKLIAIQESGVECYFDDDAETVEFLRRNGVRAYCFN